MTTLHDPRSETARGDASGMIDVATARVRELLIHLAANSPELVEADPLELADRMVASIPVRHRYDAVLGPFYDTTGLRKWLGLTRQALASRVRAGSLLACPTEDGQLVYPAWQFRSDGTTVPHLPAVIKILRPQAKTPWTVATWLRTAGGNDLDGMDAVSWLDAGRDPEPILEQARADGARWGR